MASITLEKLIDAARQHGEDSDPDHEVGDLQDLLRELFELAGDAVRERFLKSDTALSVLETGFPSEY